LSKPSREKSKVSFVVFFLIWAKIQGWDVPLIHIKICNWLDTCGARVRVLMVFRGAAKSTIYAIYKAYRLYKDRSHRSLIYAADDKLAGKLTRDTLAVLRRHPLCAGMLPPKPGALSFWVTGATDARNPSMEAVGVNSNATGSRTDAADFDDIEVPKNIKKPESRLNLRQKIEDSVHIMVPGANKTFIGTPHTHDSIYMEQIAGGADLMKIPLFEHTVRYRDTSKRTRYLFNKPVDTDGVYVIAGIHKFARMLKEGEDYKIDGGAILFERPPMVVIDICSMCAWPERFTRDEIEFRRRETRTLNSWDSQYGLEAKPIDEVRLDPGLIVPYAVDPVIRVANRQASMWLGKTQIAGMAARWDPSSAKLGSDVSAFGVVLQDLRGRRYIQLAEALTGEVAEFSDDGKRIVGGQVFQICDFVKKYRIPRIVVETNGIGAFGPAVLRAALKQFGLVCGVVEEAAVSNKNRRILESFEDVLSSRMLWAHVSVLKGPLWDQMKDFNPLTQNQADDYLDVTAGAIVDQPERIQVTPGELHIDGEWRPAGGVHEVEFER
jgi:hypothetical protein